MIIKVGGSKGLFEYEATCDRCGFTFDSDEDIDYRDFIKEIRDSGWVFRKVSGELEKNRWALLCPRCAGLI